MIEDEGGGACWLVGGCVRDCLSGITPWEIDMATTLHPQRLLELFPRALDTGSQVLSCPTYENFHITDRFDLEMRSRVTQQFFDDRFDVGFHTAAASDAS